MFIIITYIVQVHYAHILFTVMYPCILKLLDTLLIGCQDKDESIRLYYGECLGELGAIEPSLLPRRIISRGIKFYIFIMINMKFLIFLSPFKILFIL